MAASGCSDTKVAGSRGRWADGLCLLILAALLLVFFWRYVTPDASARILFPNGDFIDHYYPWRYYASLELAQGWLPLWTPFAFSGHPFLADIQTAVLYPPHLALATLLWLRDNPQLAVLEMEWLVIAHLFLAGAFTYLFVRQQTGRPLAGLASALIFTFGSYLTTYPLLQTAILEVITWAPLVLLLVSLAVDRGSLLLWGLAGAILGISTLAGHPQQSTYLHYLMVAFGLFTILTAARPEGVGVAAMARTYLPHLGGLGLALVVSVGLASAQLLPSWELVSFSSRAEDLSYSFTQGGFALREALGLLFPNSFGGKPMFLGTIPLLLAGASLGRPRRRDTLFWLGVALVAYLLSFGGNLPFYNAAHCCVPGFAWFRNQERIISLFSLAGSVLAGYGVAAVLGWAEPQARARLGLLFWAAALLAGVAALVAVAVGPLAGPLASPLAADATAVAVFAAGAALVIYLVKTRPLRRSLITVGLMGLATAQLFIVNYANLGPSGRDIYQPTPLTDFLQTLPADRRIELGDLPPLLGYFYRLPVVRGTGPLANRYLATMLKDPNSWRGWQLLTMGYYVKSLKEEVQPPLHTWGEYGVYPAPFPVAPAYVAFRARVEDDDKAVLEALAAPEDASSPEEFVFGRDVLLSEELDLTLKRKGYVRWLRTSRDEAGNLEVEVDTTAPGVLVMSEVFYPGWKAFLDGAETKLVRANYLLRAIALPPGPHRVQLVYQPNSFKVGLVASILSLSLVLGVAAVSVRWRPQCKGIALAVLLLAAGVSAIISWQRLSTPPPGTAPAQWAELSRFLNNNHLPGDALVATAEPPATPLLPAGLPIYQAGITPAPAEHPRIWWLAPLDKPGSGPPRPGPAQGWQVAGSYWFGGQHLSLLVPPEAILASAPRRMEAVLGDQVALRGYGASVERGHGQSWGGTLEVTFYWQALRNLDTDYTVFAHLLGRDGRIVSQSDAQPLGGGRPTSGWEPGEVVADRHSLSLPQGLAPGDYTLLAGLYDASTGQRLLAATDQGFVSLGQVSLGP